MRRKTIIETLSALFALIMAIFILRSPADAGGPATVTYNYDSVGRLVRDVSTLGNSGAFSYDAAGNRATGQLY